MKVTSLLVLLGVMVLVPVARAANQVVTTDAPTGSGSLTAAINALADGDQITFNIPPAAGEVHYTQNGASSNTASIHAANNAVLKIVITSTNGNGMSMYHAVTNYAGVDYPNLGFDDSEIATLGFFKATNVWVKGLCIQAAPHPTTSVYTSPGYSKAFTFAPDAPDISSNACQNFHVSGCWFGLNPVTGQLAIMPDGHTIATPHMCTATYGTGTNGTVPGYTGPQSVDASGIFGVAASSTAPRAEFNVCITPYGFDATGGPYRVCGNFWGILPDGVTGADMSDLDSGAEVSDAFCEWGGGHDLVIGTDGDGVNDADEGNIFGKYSSADANLEFYGNQGSMVIAGNTFGVDINGKSLEAGQANSENQVATGFDFSQPTFQLRFGSDFNGVSDALEKNLVVDSTLFSASGTPTTNTQWMLMRGNSLTNTATPDGSRPPIGDGQSSGDGMDQYGEFIDGTTLLGSMALIPVITSASASSLSGTCGLPVAGSPYTNLVVDLYVADPNVTHQPQGQTRLTSFVTNAPANATQNAAFTFNTAGLGITSGTPLTITVSYMNSIQPKITSVSRSHGQSTVAINNPGQGEFALQKSSSLKPTSWSTIATATGGSLTFTDGNSPESIYRTKGSAPGQTSPFSDVYIVPP